MTKTYDIKPFVEAFGEALLDEEVTARDRNDSNRHFWTLGRMYIKKNKPTLNEFVQVLLRNSDGEVNSYLNWGKVSTSAGFSSTALSDYHAYSKGGYPKEVLEGNPFKLFLQSLVMDLNKQLKEYL